MCDMANRDNKKLDLMIQENPFPLNPLTWSYPQEKKNLGKNPPISLVFKMGKKMGKGDIISVFLNIDLIRYPVECFILKYFPIRINQNSLFKIQFFSTKQ